MKERQFNTEIVKALKYWGAWAWKIPDMPVSLIRTLRFAPDHPCDIIAAYQGRFLAIEGKQSKKWEAFGLSRMQPSQIRELDCIVAGGNEAFVFLNIRIPKERINKLFIFEWAALKRKLESASIKAKELREMESTPLYRAPTAMKGKRGRPKTMAVFDLRLFLQGELNQYGMIDQEWMDYWEPGDEE